MLTVFTIFARISNPLDKPQNNAYFRLSFFIIITCIADCASALLINSVYDGVRTPIWISYAVNIVYFILTAADGCLALRYTYTILQIDSRYDKLFNTVSLIPAAFMTVFAFSTPFTKILFYFNRSGIYVFGSHHWLTVFIPSLYAVAGMVLLIGNRAKLTNLQFFSEVLFTMSVIIGMYIQNLFVPHMLLGFTAAAISIIVIYFFLQTPDSNMLIKTVTELKAEKERAENASNAKEKFLSQMSHEMRTPINGMLGMNEMILRKSTDSEITEYATIVRTSGKFLLMLINDILDYTKLSYGSVALCTAPYKPVVLVKSICETARQLIKTKPIELRISFDSLIPAELDGDEMRVKQILNNLISNAVKFTDSGFVRINVQLISSVDGSAKLRFGISDSGIGISKENIDRISESFVRLDESCTIDGTGLGLSISSLLLSLMDSSLEIESTPGIGSTFSFEISQGIVDASPAGTGDLNFSEPSDIAETESRFTAPDARVLVVDDSEINLFVMQKLLEQTHIQVDIAAGGEQCIEMAADIAYDIIFLDHMMPEPNGVETFRRIRSLEHCASSKAVVVILTANAVVGARDLYISEGFDDYLSKPVDYADLERMLIKHLPKKFIRRIECSDEYRNMNTAEYFTNADFSVLNTKIGMKYCRGDPQMYRELLDVYSTQSTGYIKRLDGDIDSGNTEDYAIVAHAIRSSSKNIGAEKLSGIAKLQEMFAKQNNIGEVISVHKMFTDTINEVVGEAKRCLNTAYEPRKKEVEPIRLSEIAPSGLVSKLKAIGEKLYYFDEKAARSELAKLSFFTCRGVPCSAKADEITDKLDIFDMDGASVLVNTWVSDLLSPDQA